MQRRALLSLLVLSLACGDDDGGVDGGSDAADTAVTCSSDDQCSDDVFCNGQERCEPSATDADAMGCVVEVACLAHQTCDEALGRCLTECEVTGDADGDGVDSIDCGGTDCDDSNADRYPGNAEVCDTGDVDEDCDPSTLGGRDADGDGAIDIACCNLGTCGTDCDDGRAGTFPGATEVCNGDDNDCDGTVDEDIAVSTFFPDCDRDGFGDNVGGVSMMGCTPPSGAPASCPAGTWTTATGDCDDGNMSRNPGNPEVCNAIDDDCDTLVDDIVDGVVVCESGAAGAVCMNACGVAGTTRCAADCLGFDACSSTAFEVCNYCDDNGNGNFNEEKPLATLDQDDRFDCGGARFPTFGVAACETDSRPSGGFLMEAVILDGSANDTAGALWLDPADWASGWGTVEVDVVLKVRAVPTGSGGAEVPLGGWSVVVASGGTLGVGTPRDEGVPRTVDGLAAKWFWSNEDSCFGGGTPPNSGDQVRYYRLNGGSHQAIRPAGTLTTSWSCTPGEGLQGGSTGFGTQTTFLEQRLRFRYTPDDPTTASVNEEEVAVLPQSPNGFGSREFIYRADDSWTPRPSGDLPIGSPLRIGITAGTYTQSGFSGPPASLVFGVPVEARVELYVFTPPMGVDGEPMWTNLGATVSRVGLCPAP